MRQVRHPRRRACPVTVPDPLAFLGARRSQTSARSKKFAIGLRGIRLSCRRGDRGVSSTWRTGSRSRCSSKDRPGPGKTELAKSVARVTGSRLIRLQCYEGLDESKALYEWNYKKQLLRIQAQQVVDGRGSAEELRVSVAGDLEDDIFSEEFLLTRPLLEAIRSRRRSSF